MLAFLAKEPMHGYELRARLIEALGVFGERVNPGQIYVTLGRLERAGLVDAQVVTQPDAPDKKVYELTAAGHAEVLAWLSSTDWSSPAPLDFHLKLVAAARTGLADPLALVDGQRRDLLRRLRDADRLLTATVTTDEHLLLSATALRLQADLRWLEQCEQAWIARGSR